MMKLFFDGTLVGLLIVAIIFCWRLNTRLQAMRQMGTELSPFMKSMSGCLGQISQSIDKLKQVADLGNQGLNENIPVAINLKDDFDLLLDYSDKMARRLDEVIERAREMDQQLQQTLRVAEGSRLHDRRSDPTAQRKMDPQQQSFQHQEPFTKDSLAGERAKTASKPFTHTPFAEGSKDVDFFVPSQSSQNGEQNANRARMRESNQKQESSIERGIMAKLRGLR
jgi:hypothetical protein